MNYVKFDEVGYFVAVYLDCRQGSAFVNPNPLWNRESHYSVLITGFIEAWWLSSVVLLCIQFKVVCLMNRVKSNHCYFNVAITIRKMLVSCLATNWLVPLIYEYVWSFTPIAVNSACMWGIKGKVDPGKVGRWRSLTYSLLGLTIFIVLSLGTALQIN